MGRFNARAHDAHGEALARWFAHNGMKVLIWGLAAIDALICIGVGAYMAYYKEFATLLGTLFLLAPIIALVGVFRIGRKTFQGSARFWVMSVSVLAYVSWFALVLWAGLSSV